jgi:kinetochore protein NNF1
MSNQSEHIRFQRLKQVCSKALEESQKVLTDENLHACYPTISSTKDGRRLIQTIKQQMIESWTANTKREFTSIFEERDIEAKLDELDELIAQAQDRMDTGTEPQLPYALRYYLSLEHYTNITASIDRLSPVNIVSSHLLPLKESNLRSLEDQLDSLKSQNTDLFKQLQDRAQEARQLRSGTFELIQNIKKMEEVSKDAQLESKLRTLVEHLESES